MIVAGASARRCYVSCECRDDIDKVLCQTDANLYQLNPRERGYDLHIDVIASYDSFKRLNQFFKKIVFEQVGGPSAGARRPARKPTSRAWSTVAQNVIDNLAGALSFFVIATIATVIYFLRAKLTVMLRGVGNSVRRRRGHTLGSGSSPTPVEGPVEVDEAAQRSISDGPSDSAPHSAAGSNFGSIESLPESLPESQDCYEESYFDSGYGREEP